MDSVLPRSLNPDEGRSHRPPTAAETTVLDYGVKRLSELLRRSDTRESRIMRSAEMRRLCHAFLKSYGPFGQ